VDVAASAASASFDERRRAIGKPFKGGRRSAEWASEL
jgi:hypothetical protein